MAPQPLCMNESVFRQQGAAAAALNEDSKNRQLKPEVPKLVSPALRRLRQVAVAIVSSGPAWATVWTPVTQNQALTTRPCGDPSSRQPKFNPDHFLRRLVQGSKEQASLLVFLSLCCLLFLPVEIILLFINSFKTSCCRGRVLPCSPG